MPVAWNLSCLDWEDRIRQGRSLMPSLPLFEEEGHFAVEFYNTLKLPDVPGTPTLRKASGEWFREIVRALFGSRDPETNFRFITEVFALAPKGSSKTSYSAALMLTALLMNTRPRAEFLLIAPTLITADVAFSQAMGMVKEDPELEKRFHIREHIKEIKDRRNGAKLKVKTFSLDVLTGQKPAGVLLDELHLLGKDADATKVIRQIRGGLQKVTEGFFVIITTQSDEAPAGAFADELKTARAIRDGKQEGKMLPILYEFPADIVKKPKKGELPAWYNPDIWHMVLPNLGLSLHLDALKQDFETEKGKGEHAIQVWGSQHLNVQIGVESRAEQWVGAKFWANCSINLTFDELLERSDVVVCGVDGGGLDDLLALGVLGRDSNTGKLLFWSRTWAHQKVLDLRKEIAPKLIQFKDNDDLVIVESPPAPEEGEEQEGIAEILGDDVVEIVDKIEEIYVQGLLPEENGIGLDPVGVGQIVNELAAREIPNELIAGITQGWKLSGAIKTAERALGEGKLLHGGQPINDWSVGNCMSVQKGNATTIDKAVSGTAKIDNMIALFNCIALMNKNPQASGSSAYEEEEVLV